MSEQKPWGGFKLFVAGLFILLVIGLFIAIFIGLNMLVGSWAWALAAILLGVFLFLFINRTPLRNKLLPILEIFFPIISKLQDEAQKRFENRSTVDKMEYTLEYYRLAQRLKEGACIPGEHCAFSPKFRLALVNDLLSEADKKNIVPHCAGRVSREMIEPVTPKILTLFYRDLHENSSVMDYRDFPADDILRTELADILDRSGLLPDRGPLPGGDDRPSPEILLERGLMPNAGAFFPYTTADIARLLKDYETYELDRLVGDLRKMGKTWALTSSYLAFLVKNKALDESFVYTVSEMLDSVESPMAGMPADMALAERLDEQSASALAALTQAGRRGLEIRFGDLPVEERESLNLIALGMFFTEVRKDLQDLKYAVCRAASESDLALRQHLAYLEYREDLREATELDGLNFVSVKYIADHWAGTVEKRRQADVPGFDKEIQAIRENLAEGNWWTRLPWLIEEVLENIRSQVQEGMENFAKVVANRPPVADVLRRIFRGLKLETIERFLEARTFTAYLLTFDGLEGSMANLIDCLSFFKGSKYRAKLTRLGVRFTYRDREKYIFKDYIKQCRIGLVPMGMNFDKFSEEFEHDLAIAYQNRAALGLPKGDIADFEIIIHRFGLSGRDRHGLEKFNQGGLRPHAVPRVRELLASSLFPEDIVALICYEQSADDGKVEMEPIIEGILAFGTITDFVGETVPKFTQVQKKALADNDQALKVKLLEKTGCASLRDLARRLHGDQKEQVRAKGMLTRLVAKLPEFDSNPATPGRISAEYIETLAEIGGL
jgi:hypothetical protein